jgi:hypothetical protein
LKKKYIQQARKSINDKECTKKNKAYEKQNLFSRMYENVQSFVFKDALN